MSAIRNMIPWLPTGSELNPFLRWNLIRPFAQWYYTRQMDKYLSREIDNCFAINKLVENGNPSGRQNPETIIGLALDKYLEGKTLWETRTNYTAFKGFAMNQMKGLILAGHGTTANTVCYIFYMLSTHPSALQRIREEHESVFGADLSKTSSAITQNPHILNQLPYTIAVIKETLRLFPADASPRKGEIGFSLKEDGHQYPTNGCMVWSMPQAIHREPLYWPQPDTFLPERWLTSPDDPLHPVKGAWRAFEFGPRNCVGQGLSMLEMKLVLALTVRKFDIRATYQEWETKQNQSPKSVNGEKAYQVMDGTNRPRGGFPCRITMAAGVKPS